MHDHIAVKYRQVFLFLSGLLGDKGSILFEQIGEKMKSENWDWGKCREVQATFFIESFNESRNAEQAAMALCSFIPFPITVNVDLESDRSCMGLFLVAEYCKRFRQIQHPVHLTVIHNYNGAVLELKGVFAYLKSCPELQDFSAYTLKPNKAFANALFDGLSNNSTLLSFTFRTLHSISSSVADIVGNGLAANKTLTTVTLELIDEGGDAWARTLEKGLSGDKLLKSIVLKIYGSMSDTAIQALNRVLINKSLTSVVMTIYWDMQDSVATAVGEGLAMQTALKSFTLIVRGNLSQVAINALEKGLLKNCSLDALEVKVFGELPDSWPTVVNGVISANKPKRSCTFYPDIRGKIATVCPILPKASLNVEQTVNLWGELSSDGWEALGRLLVDSTSPRFTVNIHGAVDDDVASSLKSYLTLRKDWSFLSFNIWGDLTTNGNLAFERLSGSHNLNLNLKVFDLKSDCCPDGLDFRSCHPSSLPSIFTEATASGTSRLSRTVSDRTVETGWALSVDWANDLQIAASNSTSLATLTLTNKNYSDKSAGWMKCLCNGVIQNASLTTLTLTFNNLENMSFCQTFVLHLRDCLEKKTSLTTLSLIVNNYSSKGEVWMGELGCGLAKNTSLTTLSLTVNSYNDKKGRWITRLDSFAKNKSLTTLTLTLTIRNGVWTRHLGRILGKKTSLTTLVVTVNNYCVRGGFQTKGLGDGLAKNNSLTSLTFNINNYSDGSELQMEGLADGLAKNTSLTSLTLIVNNYSEKSGDWMQGLGDGLARSKSLITLSLTINSCGEVNESQLLELCNKFAKSQSLTTLDLKINDHSATSRGLGCDLRKCFVDCKSLILLILTTNLYGQRNTTQ